MKTIDQIIAELPPLRRAKIESRARELTGEEMAISQLRKALGFTQEQIGLSLNIGQHSVSKLENRTDLLLSTLRSYIEAMGGHLKLVAEFKEGYAVIPSLGSIQPLRTAAPRKHEPPQPASRRKKTP